MCRTKLKLTCNTLTEENNTLHRENKTLRYILAHRDMLTQFSGELDKALAYDNPTYRMARLIYIATAIRTLKELNKGD